MPEALLANVFQYALQVGHAWATARLPKVSRGSSGEMVLAPHRRGFYPRQSAVVMRP